MTKNGHDVSSSIEGRTQKYKVLMVCNNHSVCGELLSALKSTSLYDIDVVSNSRQAIENLSSSYYEAIIIEPNLEDMDGWRLCRLVRSGALNVNKDIAIVVTSKTHSKRVAEATAREFEVNSFVSIDSIDNVVDTVADVLSNQQKRYRAKVLVIEDTADTVNLIKRFLDNRYEIDVRTDGASGLQAWREGEYDLVLLDIMLPEISGNEILKIIHNECPRQSVVVITAHCDQDIASQLMLSGAADFISKPFRANQLRQVCDIAIHREDYLVSQDQINSSVTELENSEIKYRRLIESLSDEYFIYTQLPDGAFSYVSPSVENMLGYSAEDFSKNFKLYLTGNSKKSASMKYHNDCLSNETQSRFEIEIKRKNGKLCLLEMVETPEIINNQIVAVHGIAHDATSRVERTKLLKTLAHATFEGILIYDQGVIVEVNHTVEQIFDIGRYGLIGSDIRFLIAEEQRDVVMGIIENNQYASIESVGVRADTSSFPLFIKMRKVQFNNREINVIALEDLTDKRAAEEEKEIFQKQLRQAQKMESIGHLTGGIAHDFNNILASIQGYTGLSIEMFGDNEKLNQYLTEISKASERARVLISQMLAFSRGGTSEPKPLELDQHIRDAIKMLRSTMPSTVVIQQHLPENIPPAMVDAVQFHQVIMNICINARDAISEGEGIIDISLEYTKQGKQLCSSCHQYISGDYITVKISDSGNGMDNETLNSIFDPFFSTKPVDKGTGMGLSVVHGIIHDHDGHIIVTSEKGKGTEFKLMFPMSNEAVIKDSKSHLQSQHGKGHIMVVDDDNDLAGFLKELLTQRGYDVELFLDPCKALGAFEESPDKYDLVLTDQTMPILPGHKLAQALLKKRPDLPIILCTGYSDIMDEEKSREMQIRGYLQKPVESNQLVKMINTLIIPDANSSGKIIH